MPEKISCGVKDLRKGFRRGNMMECARKKQVYFYGVKKVDKIIVDMINGKDGMKIYTKEEALGKAGGIRTRVKHLNQWIENSKNNKAKAEKIKEWEAEIERLKKEYAKLVPIANRFLKEEAEQKKLEEKEREEKQKLKEEKEKKLAKEKAKKQKAKAEKEEKKTSKRSSKKKLI